MYQFISSNSFQIKKTTSLDEVQKAISVHLPTFLSSLNFIAGFSGGFLYLCVTSKTNWQYFSVTIPQLIFLFIGTVCLSISNSYQE